MIETDRAGFQEIYMRNADRVYQISFLHLKNKADAEDAVQTVFLKYCSLKPEFRNPDHEKAWFILTTRNHCRDIMKNWWNRNRTEEEPERVCEVFSDKPYGYISDAVLKLKDRYRDLIYLYYYEEYTSAEIAAVLEKNESTVRTQLCRAREQLRKIIEKEEKQDEGRKIFQSN